MTIIQRWGTKPNSNIATGWLDDITIRHLATQTAGFEKPGGYAKLLFRPGTKWFYSDAGPNWLAECVTLSYKRDVEELMFERVFSPIGITSNDLRWRKHQYRPEQIDGVVSREFGSGVHANVNAMARFGLLYLRNGLWNERQLIPAEFIDQARIPLRTNVDLPEHQPPKKPNAQWTESHGNASQHYGLLWWNNADGTLVDVPRDAYWSWGLYDSLIVVIPSLDIVVARAGKSWHRTEGSEHYDVLKPFFAPIALSVKSKVKPPYPASQLKIEWAPKASVIRKASGSDNWPLTWGDDDIMYTAYLPTWICFVYLPVGSSKDPHAGAANRRSRQRILSHRYLRKRSCW